MQRWLPYLLVGIGGFVGANARYLLGRGVGALTDARFPWGTFIINITGSYLLGGIGWIVSQRLIPYGDEWRLAVSIGFIGAYTTFSTFEFETHALLEDGAWATAVANVVFSVLLGLIAVR